MKLLSSNPKSKLTLVLLRHGLAGDREIFHRKTHQPDSERPLTPQGRRELKPVLRALKKILKKSDSALLVSSTLVRAQQTAEMAQAKLSIKKLFFWSELKPSTLPSTTLAVLQKQTSHAVVILVGHDPHLSHFLSFILTGEVSENFHIKKGGFAVVEFKNKVEPKRAQLKCLIHPSQVRKITKRSL